MKKITLFLFILSFFASCSGTKKTQNAIESGDYNSAFNIAVEKLTKNKKKYENQVPLLKEVFTKANSRDLARLKQLKSQNPQNLKEIYEIYMNLDVRQDEIILLEPLYFEGNQVNFTTTDYSKDIAKAKKNYADELYTKASSLMYGSKLDARKAVQILEDLQYVSPNYRTDLGSLITNTKKRGSDFVFVKLHNNVANKLRDSSSLSILEDFAKIRSGDFKNKWIVLHSKRDYSVTYNYQANIYLDRFTSIPLKEETQRVEQQKEIQTGWIYQKDSNGNIMKDKEGNEIKKPKIEKVYASLILYKQSKATSLIGKVTMKNLKTNAVSNPNPIQGEAKLENVYGIYKGEPKAIDEKYYKALKNKKQQFPPDTKFNEFALQTFKLKVEQFLANYKY